MRYLCLALAVASFAATGCVVKNCTEIGCVAQFSASWSRSDGSIPSGVHQIAVTADGVTMSCMFTFTGSSVYPSCPEGPFVSVIQATTCAEIRTGNSVSQRCDPIPGQFIEGFALQGTPSSLRIVQMVDGVVLLDQSIAPTYQVVYPNGPACDPGCKQASASLTLQ